MESSENLVKIVFGKNRNKFAIFAYIIRWIEARGFNHVAVWYKDEMYESKIPKAKKSTVLKWITEYQIVKTYSFYVPKEKEETLDILLSSIIGKRYSMLQNFAILIKKIIPCLDSESKKWVINRENFLNCPEVGAMVLKTLYGSFKNDMLDTISLSDLEKECEKIVKVNSQ